MQSRWFLRFRALGSSGRRCWSTAAPAPEALQFPRGRRDLDGIASQCLQLGEDLDADHPGFFDNSYRKRRAAITANAALFKAGSSIPTVEYTPEEHSVWAGIYSRLSALRPTHAAPQLETIAKSLKAAGVVSASRIPQLDTVSRHVEAQSGWVLRPVCGLLSSRHFLNALALKNLFCTQYIRHHASPLYTPEPDICHEMGHLLLLLDEEAAALTHEVGMASLGVSDEVLTLLARIFWHTIEFGLIKTTSGTRAYGAGLLSSPGELQYCLSDEPEVIDLDMDLASRTEYPVTTYQPRYFVAKSMQDARESLKEFVSHHARRPFSVRFDGSTDGECIQTEQIS